MQVDGRVREVRVTQEYLDGAQIRARRSPQPITNQHSQHGVIAEGTRCRWRRVFKQPPPLFRRQPVPKSDAQASHALDTTNACRQFGTQQTGISRLVRDTADGCQPQIDGSGRVMALLEVDAGSAAALQDRDARRDLPSIRFMSTPAKNSKFNANASGIAVRSFTP
jgi:hypothetical protein